MVNGYSNYETWNVLLWIGNDEKMYRRAVSFMMTHKTTHRPFREFAARHLPLRTPDGVKFLDPKIDQDEADRFMAELI